MKNDWDLGIMELYLSMTKHPSKRTVMGEGGIFFFLVQTVTKPGNLIVIDVTGKAKELKKFQMIEKVIE